MEKLPLGNAHLSEEEFVEAFESCRLPASSFHHADHVRLAWIYLRSLSEAEAAARIAESIRRFAAQIGKSEKFHVTMTLAWLRLVAAALKTTPAGTGFSDFLVATPHLLDQGALAEHYSRTLLASDAARLAWVEPDLLPLPEQTSGVKA